MLAYRELLPSLIVFSFFSFLDMAASAIITTQIGAFRDDTHTQYAVSLALHAIPPPLPTRLRRLPMGMASQTHKVRTRCGPIHTHSLTLIHSNATLLLCIDSFESIHTLLLFKLDSV